MSLNCNEILLTSSFIGGFLILFFQQLSQRMASCRDEGPFLSLLFTFGTMPDIDIDLRVEVCVLAECIHFKFLQKTEYGIENACTHRQNGALRFGFCPSTPRTIS